MDIAVCDDILSDREIIRQQLITFVSDVFPCKDDAEKFVNVCNENELSLHHLRDVIEDFI